MDAKVATLRAGAVTTTKPFAFGIARACGALARPHRSRPRSSWLGLALDQATRDPPRRRTHRADAQYTVLEPSRATPAE